jgi:hypothetical protein
MAVPNTIHLAKTIDDDGLITINWSADGVESGGITYNITLLVSHNENTPATPLKGVKFIAQLNEDNSEEPLGFQGPEYGCMLAMRTEDGETIAVEHMANGVAAAHQIFVPVAEGNVSMLLTANHSIAVWRGGPTRLNLYTVAP